jgi:putative FmdB family regulatory protein
MPIYAYRCAACGHSRDVLQKLSDAPLVVCPACGAEQFAKQLTAAGFQLKGSGWYATDFRNGQSGTAAPAKSTSAEPAATGGDAAASPGSSSAAAGGTPCGGSCACH